MVQLEDTFLAALEEQQQKLLRVCSVYAEDTDDRKDLFQEVVINIWQAMPTFNGQSTISTWMYRIALNVCLRLHDKQTKKRGRFRRLDGIEFVNIRDDEPTEEEQERLIHLRACIKKLDEADKALTTLYLEGLAYKEMAEITGLSENNVAVKIKRIKAKLLNCINREL
jgi:RNA polymerase sigma-70 factor (ECF subfamily)